MGSLDGELISTQAKLGHEPCQPAGPRLRLALFATATVLGLEAAAGWAAHSLALLADAGHLLTDLFALCLAWFAALQSGRPADERRTYGYQRAGILAAAANGGLLALVAGGIALEAIRRLGHPEPVQGGLVVLAALVAVGVNGLVALRLRGSGPDLNLRAVLLHVLGDLAAEAGVVVAGLVVLLTGWVTIDPLLSLAIAALIGYGAWSVARSTVNILLEGTPPGLDLGLVRREIESFAGVHSVHDLHVWSLSAQQTAMSCHLVVRDDLLADAERTMRGLEDRLCRRFGISHTTIQLESSQPCAAELRHGPGEHNHPHPQS